MAVFKIAYDKTSKNEGGYVNDPKDNGGETWKGIARKFHPTWVGWTIIDTAKKEKDFPKSLKTLSSLEYAVESFYKTEFWNVIRGDEILLQPVADSIYDSSVNMGCSRAIKLAQTSLKCAVTGKMDDTTLNLLNNKKA